jgi:hypothetical protein
LTLPELKAFNKIIKDNYDGWVDQAPADWKDDKWLVSRQPLGVVALYGQNQPIALAGANFQNELSNWNMAHDYSKAKWMSYAVATHVE